MKKQLIIDGNLTNYYADEDGIIYNKTGKIIKITEKGTAQLRISGKSKNCSVGRIIAENFIPNENAKDYLVRHLDGNRQNNSVENLCWITQQDNAANTWQKRRENGTTGAGEVRGPREKRENIVETLMPLKTNEKQIKIDGELIPYGITTEGKVRNLIRGNELTGSILNTYQYINFRWNGQNKNKAVHRLVAEAFLEPLEGATMVDHIDGNRLNNCVENLRWVDPKENRANVHIDLTPQKTRNEYIFSEEELLNEEWREYLGYCVSSLGRVRGQRNNILLGTVLDCGYISYSIGNVKKLGHVLVWEAFKGKAKSMDINHINGDKQDNRLVNLEEVTHQENMVKAAYETNAWNFRKVGAYKGEELVNIYSNATEAAKAIGILPSSMRNTIRRNGKCHDGLSYRYIENATS